MATDTLPAETLPKVLRLWSPFATFATVKSKVYLTTLEVSKHVHTIMYRCGKDLQKLFRLPSVQRFFNCLPPHKIYQEKDIYKPGILRKVHTAHTTQFMPSFINKTYLPLIKMQGKVLFHEATVSTWRLERSPLAHCRGPSVFNLTCLQMSSSINMEQ